MISLTMPEPIGSFMAKSEALSTVGRFDDAPRQADPDNARLDLPPKPEKVANDPESQAENVVAQYFRDVRHYSLLSRAEEQALWAQIAHRKARLHRALYTSPVALTTLLRVWQQVAGGELPLKQVLGDHEATPEQQAESRTRFGEAVRSLQHLHTAMQELRTQIRVTSWSARERRVLRQEWARLWRQWIASWDTLALSPKAYETVQRALEAELQARPDHAALRAAHTAWRRAWQQLAAAKEQMLQANLRLVIHVANHYRGRGVPLLDLIQEGNIGLMRAVEKFEPQRGVKFVTYAHWWVRQAVSRALMEQHRSVRLPNYVVERQNKLRTISDGLWDTHGREPSVQELSTASGWTAEEVAELQMVGQAIVRLHTPVTENGKMLADIVEDARTLQPEERQAEAQLHHRLAHCLDRLSAREAFILRRRYGLESNHAHTLQEIADLLGLSRERIRQVERKALEKLREPDCRHLLADFAGV